MNDHIRIPLQVARALLIAGFLSLQSSVLIAADATEGLTADEILRQGTLAYNGNDFAQAEAAFRKFLIGYGDNAEAKMALPKVLPMLVTAQLRLAKYPEALATIQQYFEEVEDPDAAVAEELLFWKAACQLQGMAVESAIETFDQFLKTYPQSPKHDEAVVLLASSLAIAGRHAEVPEFIDRMQPRVQAINQSRLQVLKLHSMVEGGLYDEACEIFLNVSESYDDVVQVVSLQTLALRMGSYFLDEGKYHQAIACLQRVWRHERLMSEQQIRLDELNKRLEVAKQSQVKRFEALTLGQLIAKVDRELEHFAEIENFDSALRLRHASAYLGMERHREAALILEDMLVRMPPDQIVEQGALNLMRCWMQIERWPKVLAAADEFAEKFPESKFLPLVLFMKGKAQQGDRDYENALATFGEIVTDFPEHDLAARSEFMVGFTHILDDNYPRAIEVLEAFPKSFPESSLVDTVHYWRGMAYSMDNQHETCREIMQAYIKEHPNGIYRSNAEYRHAYSTMSLAEYEKAIDELKAFLSKYENHESTSEALLLLGDAYLAMGEIDAGIAALKRIPAKEVKLFEEGWFKIGKALRLVERFDALEEHMRSFISRYPDSPRLPEAVYWQGWVYDHERNDRETAKSIYQDAVETYGNDPRRKAVEELFTGMIRFYPGDEGRKEYLAKLSAMLAEAESDERETLAMRLLWAKGKLLLKMQDDEAEDTFIQAAEYIRVDTTNPVILFDIAKAYEVKGDTEKAEGLYRDLVKWNPRSLLKDQAIAALGMLAIDRGDTEAALEHFARFEEDLLESSLYVEVMKAKAGLLQAEGRIDEAREVLEGLLTEESASSSDKAAVLYAMGELEMEAGRPVRAVPYFQRVYVMYGNALETVAQSYLRSGEAFEKLNKPEDAKRTYLELVEQEELSEFPAVESARERLENLGGMDS